MIPALLASSLSQHLALQKPFRLNHVAEGAEALALAELARAQFKANVEAPALICFIAREGTRAQAIEQALAFFAPEIEVLFLPAWDCQPYDRASPNAAVMAARMLTLSRIVRSRGGERPRILITTVNGMLQRLPPRAWVARQSLSVAPGHAVDLKNLSEWLEANGYTRNSIVRESGDYAIRGGIVDLFPPGFPEPLRLDFFGDTLETIRAFDPETQRSTGTLKSLDLVPMSEVHMTSEAIRRFRQGYVASFGTAMRGDPLYEAISEGRKFIGQEHWLPLFHGKLDSLSEYLHGTRYVLDHQAENAARERFKTIHDYFDARKNSLEAATSTSVPYKPLPPEHLYLKDTEWQALQTVAITLTPFGEGAEKQGQASVSFQTNAGRNFEAERAVEKSNVFDAVAAYIHQEQAKGRKLVIAAWSEGSKDRLAGVLADHGLEQLKPIIAAHEIVALTKDQVALAAFALERGFMLPDVTIISEQDILGERLARPRRAAKKAKDFLAEAANLALNDVVVHVNHGIARFVGLKTITAAGAPHDCLELHYAGGDKLFLPVENIELLSRYGSEDTEATLDRLGGAGWQARKARLKKRIRDIAKQLIKVAAARMLREAPRLVPPEGAWQEFCARFPYNETDDQLSTIESVLDDMGKGRPMDRLVCGDVGFGKTEVALRAAFVAALGGKQVAVVVPTTLLARQHYRTFATRFEGLPLNIAQASRLVSAADLKKTKEGLASGGVDIVVGTHALLGKSINFKDLGLLIVDEEQHFGVSHKERLKELRSDVHVLTLSATPIPRTLQLALTGVRELSLITTPPVDRLATRTFVSPFDPLMVREALLRERYRGGQSFYVCPRLEDIAEVRGFLAQHVPEVKVGVGHGQMAATELEEVMSQFYDGKFDVLLSTTIVESGLDIPAANTLIVHRADMFGLSQLYQLRGRVGRSKTRAFAIFTTPVNKKITPTAERRLQVLQSLDALGAGFQLANHDLDIRGSGNLLGEEQSGHVREVGFELYQNMLQEAVAALKAGVEESDEEEAWSPSIAIGTPVIIPESYIADLELRMGLYRRLAALDTEEAIESFAAELIDRFGKLPVEVEQLMRIVAIKALCRRANVEKVEAGPKGIILAFRDNSFARPEALVRYIGEKGSAAKVRPDMRIVFIGEYADATRRLNATRRILTELVGIAETKKKVQN